MARYLRQMPEDPFVGHVRKDSIERLRKQAERNAGLIFASVYLLFLLAGVVALVVAVKVWAVGLDWLYAVLFGPLLVAAVPSMVYYTIQTWDLPPTDE